ncbi:hypothetical protein BDR07DRAFT_1363556, partial [Suillus spraguei]
VNSVSSHNFSQQTFSLTPNAQIWPRSLNTKIGVIHAALLHCIRYHQLLRRFFQNLVH